MSILLLDASAVAAGLAHGTGIPATLWLNFERIFRAGLAEGKTWTP